MSTTTSSFTPTAPDLSLTTTELGPLDPYAVNVEQYPPTTQESLWKILPSQDGWTLAHNALRGELDLLTQALKKVTTTTTTVADESTPASLEPWKMESLQAMWKHHDVHVRAHQTAEEEILQPKLAERIQYPEKLSGGHKVLYGLLDRVQAGLDEFVKDSKSSTALLQAFDHYQKDLREHLHHEEVWGIPLMRAYFSQAEFKSTGQQMGKHSGPPGSFVYFQGQDEATGQFLFQTEFMPNHGMPSFLWYVVFQPAVKQFHKDFLRHAEALVDTNEPPSDDSSSCQVS
mmetsp:Transcript_25/g.128  ORF Transcript_25/g.128 Transcript_25/m.128 type:complete len:287 (-) Transcript_25:210-1070(-)|eukprot:CAMPEP_0168735282 /NCGR_PEP_ID=MMETSP0724-20121128/9252_1 /TAXON_ID=265536 /ORGANISM="Amphiprora sp., Strain CCMP467" /LENGTH=286 /DNA_ID=CAMNT_0008782419 /DNA_START=22 /DNA_END=885 /DNA_ORIENTATION=+